MHNPNLPGRQATRRTSSVLALLLMVSALAGCANANPHFNPAKSHHTVDGFVNNDGRAVVEPFSALVKWQWEAFRQNLPPAPKAPTPAQAPDLAWIHANARAGASMQPAVTWIGHASTLVQASGLNVLTDPMFSERAFPVQFAGPKRSQPPGLALADLPPIDLVVISHNHYDHLDRNSVFALNQKANGATLFLVPLGLKAWMADIGIDNVVELDWWDSVKIYRQPDGKPSVTAPAIASNLAQPVQVFLTPVQHWSARGVGDRSKTLWGGWAVFGAGFNWYFSGDAGYSKDFADTFKHFADRRPVGQNGKLFDLALIPVGAYEPRWFMKVQHINPTEAVQVHQDLGSMRSLGIHWGTFNLTDEALDRPPIDLKAARQAQGLTPEDFFLLKVGETRQLPRR